MPVVGITFNEISSATPSSPSNVIDRVYVLMTASGAAAADINKPVQVRDLGAFQNRFSGAPEIAFASMRLLFLNNPKANVYVVASGSPAGGNTSQPNTVTGTNLQSLVAGANAIKESTDQELGFIICPEHSALPDQGDRTALFTAIHDICLKHNWIFLINSPLTVTDDQKALEDRKLYASPLGHAAYYFKMEKDISGKDVPITPYVAAIALRRASDQSPFSPPGGAKYPIVGLADTTVTVNETVYRNLQAANINVLQQIPRVGKCMWGARTLSTDDRFMQLNTRMATSIITRQLRNQLIPYLFESSDPQGYTKREIVRQITSVLQTAYNLGGLSGSSPERAYKIEELVVEEKNLRRIFIRIYAAFVDTLEMIEVTLINVMEIPDSGNVIVSGFNLAQQTNLPTLSTSK